MPVILKIEGWDVSGFRCPDHKIDFLASDGEVYPITLLQMPNGTGKTTTLQLLRAALGGGADGWSKHKVRAFAKDGNARGEGHFIIHLRLNRSKLTIVMHFDFADGTVTYTTTYGAGLVSGHMPPKQISRFLRPGFVDFFVFDGELAERLLSNEYTNAEQIIDDLFQLGLFRFIDTATADYWNEKVRKRGAGEQKGLTQRRNKVGALEQRVTMLQRRYNEAKQNLERHESDLAAQQSRFSASLQAKEALRERIERVEADLDAALSEVRTAAHTLLSILRAPEAVSPAFAADILTFKNSLDRVKLPESAAREFFEELAVEPECVCGRPLDEETRASIRDRAGQYLGSDDVAVLNAIKGDIAVRIPNDTQSSDMAASVQIENLRQASRKEMEARTERDAIQAEGVASDPELERAQARIDDLRQLLDAAKSEVEKYESVNDTSGDDGTFGIRVLEKRLETAKRLLAEITQTVEMKAKRDVLKLLLDVMQKSARQGIGAAVCDETNNRIMELMPDNRIRIERIDRCLVLRDQEGGSVGETLSIAYAFLSTLFNRTDHSLPFVVDSPANSIDLRVRAKVAELVPRLTQQFVAFTISSERQSFIGPLERSAPGPIQYITLFRRGSALDTNVEPNSFSESVDGLCIQGAAYFRAFHINQEDDDAV